jgi:hypothetical protein
MRNFAYIVLLWFATTALCLNAQTDTAKQGKLTINADKKIEQYIEQRKQQNIEDSLSKGYRIQIIITDKRFDAKDAKEKFSNMFPNCPAYLIFDSPYFKVRVGDFKTKLEAQALLFKLTDDFPTLFLVDDKINPPPISPCY